MLIDMELQAIELGIPADMYWIMTFDEIMLQCSANEKIKERELKEKAMFDYNMVHIMKYAFNSPDKIPEFDKAYPMFKEKEGVKKVEPQKPYVEETDQAIFLEMTKNVKNFNKNKEQ